MSKSIITEATIQDLQGIVAELGWKAEIGGTKEQPQLVSAVNGVNFNIRVGTAAKDKAGWTDFTISAPFTVDQEVSPVVGAFWNRRNRFARVYRVNEQLFLDMDMVFTGGVSRDHIKYLLAIWSDVSRLFVEHLRQDHAVLARYKAGKAGSGPKTNAGQGAPASASPKGGASNAAAGRASGQTGKPAARSSAERSTEGSNGKAKTTASQGS